jgi:hypothetical protein
MNQLPHAPTLHQILDSTIRLDETLQKSIRQIRTIHPIDIPADLNSPTFTLTSALMHTLLTAIALCQTLKNLSHKEPPHVSR